MNPSLTRQELTSAFSHRLVKLLKKQGFDSNTASSGVKVKALSEKLGVSLQIARRYTLGEALPEPEQLLKIAAWLSVSPGWLLFGEKTEKTYQHDVSSSSIDTALLRYVLTKVSPLMMNAVDQNEMIEFIMGILYDATHLKANQKMIYQMIDVAVNSVERLYKKKRKMS